MEQANFEVVQAEQMAVCVPRELGTVVDSETIAADPYLTRAVGISKPVKPLLHVHINAGGRDLSLFLVHMPGGLNHLQGTALARNFYRKCREYAAGRPSVLVGDFNSGGSHLFAHCFPRAVFADAPGTSQHDHIVAMDGAKHDSREEHWFYNYLSGERVWLTDHPYISGVVTL